MVCETPDLSAKSLASGLDSSGWLKHIKSVLDTSVFIAKVMASYFVLLFFTFTYKSKAVVKKKKKFSRSPQGQQAWIQEKNVAVFR